MSVRRSLFTLAVGLMLMVSAIAQAQTVTLQIGMGSDAVDQLVPDFLAKHPGIDVELLASYGQDFEKLVVEHIGGVAPDVVHIWGSAPPLAMRNGLLLSLTPYIERNNLERLVQDFVPGTVDEATMGGQLYGLPYCSTSAAMWLNMVHLDAAGVAIPPRNWSWDDYADTARKLTRIAPDGAAEVWGHVLLRSWGNMMTWFWAGGAEAHPAEDPSTVTLDSPEAVYTLEFLRELVEAQAVEIVNWRGFRDGLGAMWNSGAWEIGVLQGMDLGVTSLPVGPLGRKVTYTNSDLVAIVSSTEHPDEAWAFVQWFYSDDVQRRFLELGGLQPARLSYGMDWIASVQEANPDTRVQGLEVFVEDAIFARPQPSFSDASVINQILRPAIDRVLIEGAPAPQTMSEASRVATATLQGQ